MLKKAAVSNKDIPFSIIEFSLCVICTPFLEKLSHHPTYISLPNLK